MHGQPAQPALDLTLFGRFTLQSREGPKPIPLQQKPQELLAYLVVSPPGPLARHLVANALWAGARTDVDKQFRQVLWRLRRSLRPHARTEPVIRVDRIWIECRRHRLLDADFWRLQRLSEPDPHDVDFARGESAFERALAIDALCDRPLLEGWNHRWVEEIRKWVRSRHLKALDEIVRWHQASADHERVLEFAARALALNSSLEAYHRARIEAYLGLGDRVGAARAYRRCVDVLRSEYGLDPVEETTELGRRVLGPRKGRA